MRLYSGRFKMMASETIKTLLESELIEIQPALREEAELDVVGVLREYRRMDRELTQRARDMVGSDGRAAESKMKRRLARDKNFKLGDDGLGYLVNQTIQMFDFSGNIEEIFGTDRELRAKITPVFKKYTASQDDELDREVRSKIKNLQEGSSAWDIEYERVMERARMRRGLEKDED